MILRQETGTGTTSFDVDPLPKGYSRLGIAVQCLSVGKWTAAIDSDGGDEFSSDCSLNGGAAGSSELTDPTASQVVTVQVAEGAKTWVTIFADLPEDTEE